MLSQQDFTGNTDEKTSLCMKLYYWENNRFHPSKFNNTDVSTVSSYCCIIG